MTGDALARAAARAALAELPDEGVVGLGSGSTAAWFVEALGELVRDGRRLVGVPTSTATREHARAVGIPLLDDAGPWPIAVTVDGADEVDPELDLIKGRGGALAREKIVSASSARTVIVVVEAKLSPQLGRRPIPIEVLAFGHLATRDHLARLGDPVLRERRSDGGNPIYDLAVAPIADKRALDAQLRAIPGVVETGLFLGCADLVIVATDRGIRWLSRPTPAGPRTPRSAPG